MIGVRNPDWTELPDIGEPAPLTAFGPARHLWGIVQFQPFRDAEETAQQDKRAAAKRRWDNQARRRALPLGRPFGPEELELAPATPGRPTESAAERNGRPPDPDPDPTPTPIPFAYPSCVVTPTTLRVPYTLGPHPAPEGVTTGVFVPVTLTATGATVPLWRRVPTLPAFDFDDDPPEPELKLIDHYMEFAGAAVALLPRDWIDDRIRPLVRRWLRGRLSEKHTNWEANYPWGDGHVGWLDRQRDPAAALDRLTNDALPAVMVELAPWEKWSLLLVAVLLGMEFVREYPTPYNRRDDPGGVERRYQSGGRWDPSAAGESGRHYDDPEWVIPYPCEASEALCHRLATEAQERGGSGGQLSPLPHAGPERDRWIAERWRLEGKRRYGSKRRFGEAHGLGEEEVKDALERVRKQQERTRDRKRQEQDQQRRLKRPDAG